MFILSSLMSTCELDRFVIQTPYIKVVKSCSAPFADARRSERTLLDRAPSLSLPPLISGPRVACRSNRSTDRGRGRRGKEEASFLARRGKTPTNNFSKRVLGLPLSRRREEETIQDFRDKYSRANSLHLLRIS